jgi:cyclic pyranopterin phosphate synthase
MVDVGPKAVTTRSAAARARVRMNRAAMAALQGGTVAKGDALAVARLAGIQGAKRTAEWIPLCHPLALDHVAVTIELDPRRCAATITSEVAATARTGVEMEALVAVLAAAAALYDMLKAVDRAIVIEEVLVLEKRGGKCGVFTHPEADGRGRGGRSGRTR